MEDVEAYVYRAIGRIQELDLRIKKDRRRRYLLIRDIKDRKGYKQLGMTWEEFCKEIGESCRGVDRHLEMIETNKQEE